MPRRSAGILLFKVHNGQLTVLLVHPGGPLWRNKDAGAWSIPKGEFGTDEQAKAAAFREFAEETGAALADTGALDLGEIRQKGGKSVSAWAVEGDFDPESLRSNVFEMTWPPRSGRTEQFPEVDRAQWYDLGAAREKINPAQTGLLDRLLTLLRERGCIDPEP